MWLFVLLFFQKRGGRTHPTCRDVFYIFLTPPFSASLGLIVRLKLEKKIPNIGGKKLDTKEKKKENEMADAFVYSSLLTVFFSFQLLE